MKKIILLIIYCVLFSSCYNKTVQLPETHNADITVIEDVSAAYLFYDEEKDSVDFNRKNLISTTHWLVNVDKRLTLKQALPSILYLQDKRGKAGMHKNENAKNYFSCSNPDIQNLAFIEFTDVVFSESSSTFENKMQKVLQEQATFFMDRSYVKGADIWADIDIIVESQDGVYFLDRKNNLTNFASDLKNIIATHSKANHFAISLSFNKNITFQDYITCKSLMLKLKSSNVVIMNEEFIYN